MRILHPRSTPTLILYGFGVVVLPLFFALGYAALYVDRLSGQAQTAVYNAAQAIQGSRSLSEALIGLERNARQYLLLDDGGLLETYKTGHQDFQAIVDRLEVVTSEATLRSAIRDIGQREQTLFDRLSAKTAESNMTQEEVAEIFIGLNETAAVIRQGSNRLIDREVRVMQETAANARRMLLWMGFALIPLTLGSTAAFTVLISRPVRQVDRAIRQLGDAHFERRIGVSGPEDLRALGQRLEWLRRRLIELEEQKARFLRHVSHELKTPLTSIRESSALLGDGVVGPLNAEQQEIAEILQDSGRQLQGLIENLLDYSRSQSHRPALSVSPVDVNELIEAVLQNHKPEIRAKSLQPQAGLADCHVLGDREKLRIVFDNLVSNAIKFSPPGADLTVITRQTRSEAVVEVRDQGPGIPLQERDRIFEAFYQGVTQPEGYVKGSGLGLSIAREYVLAHQGHIAILDTNGVGARLRVTLPRRVTASRG